MEKELLKEYKPVLARLGELETQYQPIEQSDIKEIIHDVLQELQSSENCVAKMVQRRINSSSITLEI